MSITTGIRGRSNLLAPHSYRPAICEVDRSVFLMGSVIRAWQGLGGLKLTRLMAEQIAQSQLSPAHELDGVEQEGTWLL